MITRKYELSDLKRLLRPTFSQNSVNPLILMKTAMFALMLGFVPQLATPALATPPASLTIREVHYAARLADDEARISMAVEAEAVGIGAGSAKLLTGDVAVMPNKLDNRLKVIRGGNDYLLVASHAGQYKITLEIIAKIQHAEPWNQVAFTGPTATIASVTAQAAGTNTEVQLLAGTPLENFQTNGVSGVTGFLGADSMVSLRWQSKVTAIARKALLTVDSAVTVQATPAAVRYTSKFHYDVVQGGVTQIALGLPVSQTLTRLEGSQIRDWHLTTAGDRQTLTIEFIKPVENGYDLTLYSEQPVNGPTEKVDPPQPLDSDRESGSITVVAEDTVAEVAELNALRQVNAPDNAVAAYRFNARPFALALKLKHIEPAVSVADRITARLEETRLVIAHNLALNVQKAGIYTLELSPQPGFSVADVRGEGVEDWKVHDHKVRVNFSTRVLGSRQLQVQLEQAFKTFPEQVSIAPLRTADAAKETAEIGAASVPGIRLKAGSLSGLREIPVNLLTGKADEILAFTADQRDWNVSIACERLAARVVADVFNLATVADGIVGGSATIRYGLMNQGVQEFQVRVPTKYKNVEFTGPNIRSKEQSGDVWTIGLQDKVWGGYTLVVTYDFQFDAASTTLPLGGIHAVNVERETGSVALTTAASLQLTPQASGDAPHRVDETELAAADRALITRAVVFAWQYTGDQYDLKLAVQRFTEVPVLEAVADRTQITSVLAGNGQMLTQASFMVKNNDKQFQRFELPADSRLWSCYVDGQPAKPERDAGWVLVPLPRDANRDQASAVDIVYAQTNGTLASTFGKKLVLNAPRTDVANTYAEWQLFVPPTLRLSGFGGSMNVTQGTTYELFDAWQKFLSFYGEVLREAGGGIFVIALLAALVFGLVISAVRRGWSGVLTLFAVMAILMVLGAMLLPALSSAKRKAQSISSVNSLKQIGLAARIFSGDNGDRLPTSFEEMSNELSTTKITYDPATGQRYTYLGGGLSTDRLKPDSVLAYSAPDEHGRCGVLFVDGSVEVVTAQKFAELSQRGLVQVAAPQDLAEKQREEVAQSQFAAKASAVNGAPTAQITLPAAMPTPIASGIRSIRIELTQTGMPFMFTKVLNVHGEPLSIHASVTTLRTFQEMQMLWQSAAFLLGLGVWWLEWRRVNRRSLILTLALALIIGSVFSLLIQWRALHDALIIGFPVVVVAVVAWLVWKCWPRDRQVATPQTPPEPPIHPGTPPVFASIAIASVFAFTAINYASAGEFNAVPVFSALYSGTVNDRVAELDATLTFSPVQVGDIVPLFDNDVAVRQFSAKNNVAKLVRNTNGLSVQFQRQGDATLQFGLLVKVAGEVTKRRLAFAIPPAISSRMSLTLAEAGADVEFPAAVSFKRSLDRDKTRVEAVIGDADRIELFWTPRVKHAEEVAATVFCQDAALATIGAGMMKVRTMVDYEITQGELRQARIELPAGQKLLRVEGRDLRSWEIKRENGSQILVVDLVKGIPDKSQLTVETEQPLGALPTSVAVELPHAMDVKRESGLVALQSSEELGLTVELAEGLERVDADKFARATKENSDRPPTVLRFTGTKFSLHVRAESFQPEIEAVVKNNFRVGAEQLLLSSSVDYVIKRTGVFTLELALPEGFRVESVGGKCVQQWTEKNELAARVLEISLKERVTGANSMNITLVRQYKSLPEKILLAGVHPLNTVKQTGFIAVSAEPGVEVRTDSFEGLTEVPAVSLPDYNALAGAGSVLAYKYISAEPTSLPEWKLSVATESVAAWVRAEIVNSFTLTETLVSGRAQILYSIANAPVKEFRLRVPAEFKDVEISGANLRSREQDGNIWRIELQSPARKTYTLTVTWDEPRPAGNGALELMGVSADGVERESGFLAVSVQPPIQVTEAEAKDLQRADTGDVPTWAAGTEAATLVYRYVRPGYKLGLEVRRFDEAEVLQTIVDSAKFTSVVAADGQMMTEMSLSVRNNGRQFLAVQLPANSTVCSAFGAAQPVRPSLREGRLLLPIESSGADDGAMPVELTYVGTNAFPKSQGKVGFTSPRFDVPLKNAHWEVFLPPDYDYQDLRQGTMTRETAATADPSSASFSILEYSRMEQASKESVKVETQREVSQARQQLAGGNFREANASFSRAKSQSSVKDEDADVKKLGEELKSAQASNLINAQNDFYFRNGGQLVAEAQTTNQPGQTSGRSDETVAAGEQWTKLQQAQEIATANVQPLRMNLPLRGQRIAFMQVLQTEAGQPMTFLLSADNTKTIHWSSRLGWGALAFLVLWGAVSVLSRVLQNKGKVRR